MYQTHECIYYMKYTSPYHYQYTGKIILAWFMSHDNYVTNMCMNEERGNLISWQIYRQMLRASKRVFVISCFFLSSIVLRLPTLTNNRPHKYCTLLFGRLWQSSNWLPIKYYNSAYMFEQIRPIRPICELYKIILNRKQWFLTQTR